MSAISEDGMDKWLDDAYPNLDQTTKQISHMR